MRNLTAITILFVVCALIVGVIVLQVSVWNECRAEHSFWYCVNLVSGK